MLRTMSFSRSKLDVANNVVPIEVKSGKNASHRSLDKFVAKFQSYVSKPYLLWMKDRKTQAGVEYLPIYMASCLAEAQGETISGGKMRVCDLH